MIIMIYDYFFELLLLMHVLSNKYNVCMYSAAGDAFCRAASVQIKCGSKHEAATQYVDASTCYKKADPAGNCYNSALVYVIFN